MSSETSSTRTAILEATWKLMEQTRGQGVKMSDIAKAAGVSRQAVYLHFATRAELMIQTVNYVDEQKGLKQRLAQYRAARSGVDLLDACIDIWGNYIPEIYGLAKALMLTKENDDATAAAWQGSMSTLRQFCSEVIAALEQDKKLSPKWSPAQATEILWTMISINNWEQWTIECGWNNDDYISRLKTLLKQILLAP